jgi:hypothetical protein
MTQGIRSASQSLFGEPNDLKERQTSKIKELADALVAAGFVSLDDQASALGLSRSTTWTILAGKHKNYGLSAALIKRVLDKHDLNSRVRIKIIEYVREKAMGSYGHNLNQLRRFTRQLAGTTATLPHEILFADPTARQTYSQAAHRTKIAHERQAR